MSSLLQKIKKQVRRWFTFFIINFLKKQTFPLINKKYLSLIMNGHPYIHDDEIRLFAKMASQSQGTIVEIGCAFGASSSIFLLHSKKGTVLHSIDPFIQDSMREFQANQKTCRKNVNFILKAFGKEHKIDDWEMYTDYSYNVVKKWDESIDMIFIDGDHHYEAVKKDFEDWLPFVKKNGYILFHDSRKEVGTPRDTFNRGWAGPTDFVNKLRHSNSVRLVNEEFSVTVWQKK